MKKLLKISAVLAVALAAVLSSACAQNAESNGDLQNSGVGSGENVVVNTPKLPANAEDMGIPQNAISLTTENNHNSATAYFSAEYNENGIVLTAHVMDDDIHDKIYYSHGFDDNVEYLIGLKCSNPTGWDENKTLHFLITPDGDTFFQRSNSGSTFTNTYVSELRCVYGENFSYSAEYTDYGYKTQVFLGYELFGVDESAGRGNLYVCPAMRNTHDYSDTVWQSFAEGGCEWGNASSFIRVSEEGYQV